MCEREVRIRNLERLSFDADINKGIIEATPIGNPVIITSSNHSSKKREEKLFKEAVESYSPNEANAYSRGEGVLSNSRDETYWSVQYYKVLR